MGLERKNIPKNKDTIELKRVEPSGDIVTAELRGNPDQKKALLDSFFLTAKPTQLKNNLKDDTAETSHLSSPPSYNEHTNSRGRYTVDILEPKDFKGNYTYSNENQNELNEESKDLPKLQIIGTLSDEKVYIKSVDLIMKASFEREHRDEIITRMLLPKRQHCKHILDIGVGSGELSKILDVGCEFVTAIDTRQESLNNLPDIMGTSDNKVDKILGTVLETEIPDKKYDFIVLSHMLYYIDENQRIKLIDKLYNLLSDKGTILIIYNDNGDREPIGNYFDGTKQGFSKTIKHIQEQYTDKYYYQSPEIIKSNDIETLIHIIGVILNDASTTASREDIIKYANTHLICDPEKHAAALSNEEKQYCSDNSPTPNSSSNLYSEHETLYCIGLTQHVMTISNHKGNLYEADI